MRRPPSFVAALLAAAALSLFAAAIKVAVIERPEAADRVRGACDAAWRACLDRAAYPACLAQDRAEAGIRHYWWHDEGICGWIRSECWAGATAKAAGGPWR